VIQGQGQLGRGTGQTDAQETEQSGMDGEGKIAEVREEKSGEREKSGGEEKRGQWAAARHRRMARPKSYASMRSQLGHRMGGE